MPLYVDTGFRSSRRNDESCLVVVPDAEQDITLGAMLAIADGLTERANPETAARDAVKTFGDHYYAAPETWGLKHALQESLLAANRSLIAGNESGRAAALSALVLRRRRWAVVHAGHTRIWMMRDDQIKLLTHDHVAPRVARASQVERACGLAPHLEADFLAGEIVDGDVFVLTNEGAHGNLTGAEILACVIGDLPAAQMASMIIDKAGNTGASTNACACVVRVEQVPPETEVDLEEDIAALPAIAPPAIDHVLDGFRIQRLVHKSSRYRLYKALDTVNDQIVALKFPNPRDADDPGFAERFLREEWIGRRVSSAHLVPTLSLKKGRRTVLYSVMGYPAGESLAKRLARKRTLPLREVAFVGDQLLEALGQLHDQGVIHNDVRPQNIVMDQKSGQLMLLGLGSSHVTHTSTSEQDTESSSNSRRGSFLAPELFEDRTEPTLRSDIYAVGVTLYRMLTGSYPYGKVTPGGKAIHDQYRAATHHRSDVPAQLDAVLRRACAFDPEHRFDSPQEFASALQVAMTQELSAEPADTSATSTSRRWNWEVAVVGMLVLLLLVYLVLALRR